jgi:hypothetical protein
MLTFNIAFALQSLALFETYHRPSCRSFIYENTFFQRSQMQNTLATEYVPAIITGTVSAKKWEDPRLATHGIVAPMNAPGISIAIYNSQPNTITSNVTINLSNPNPNPNT